MSRRASRTFHELTTFVLFVAPNAILFLLFSYYPILKTFWMSLTDSRLFGDSPGKYSGENYAALWSDSTFWHVVSNTLLYAVLVIVTAQGIGFLLAILLNRPIPVRAVFRTLCFTPHVVTPAAAALVWILVLDPRLGPLAPMFRLLGADDRPWVGLSHLSLYAIVVVGVWKEIGFSAIFFLAGLQGLPKECLEAARLETSSRWMVLRHITLPLMTPIFFFLLVTGFIASIKVFDLVLIMTKGGPVYPDSSTYVYHLYRLAFQDFRAGYASAFAIVFFVVALLVTAIQFRLARRWVHAGE